MTGAPRRVGSDTGGTFTDIVADDGTIANVPSTPHDPSAAVERGLIELVPHLRTFALSRRPDDTARGVGARHRSAAAPPRLLLASDAPGSPITAQTFLDAALA
jgi:hypothetical protein